MRLLVFGAGDDAIPLTDLQNIWVGASRFSMAFALRAAQKFPSADEVIVRIAGAPPPRIDPWTVAVLMSHSYSQDLAALRELADLPLRYLGILGPRKRTAQLLEEAGLNRERMSAKLHGPMGLDIGADGPEK